MRNGYGKGGMGKGGGMGRGRGGGGGRGRRRGMGQGHGVGRGFGKGEGFMPPADSALHSESQDINQETRTLRAQAQDLMAHLRAIKNRIGEIRGTGTVSPVSLGEQQNYSPNKEKNSLKMTAVVNKDRCICCGFCVDICPEEAIAMNNTAVIDPNKCIACGSCIDECPQEAISLPGMKKRTAT
jgi:NAD-dependent dihydropyrimidine dehydrogenase PreA subunit